MPRDERNNIKHRYWCTFSRGGDVRLSLMPQSSMGKRFGPCFRSHPPSHPLFHAHHNRYRPGPRRTRRCRDPSSDRRVGAVSPRGRSVSPQQEHQPQAGSSDRFSPRSKKPSVRHLMQGHSGSVSALAVFEGMHEYVTAGYDRWVVALTSSCARGGATYQFLPEILFLYSTPGFCE